MISVAIFYLPKKLGQYYIHEEDEEKEGCSRNHRLSWILQETEDLLADYYPECCSNTYCLWNQCMLQKRYIHVDILIYKWHF